MKERVIEIVRRMLGENRIDSVAMETEDDLGRWLDERKRFRDLNELALQELDERLGTVAAREDNGLRTFAKTLPKSLARRRCLTDIQDARDEAAGIEQIRNIRRKNVKLNRVLITEVEKAIAAAEVGLVGEAVDEMLLRFRDAMQDWRVTGDSVEMGDRTAVESEDDDLASLEQELGAMEVPAETGLTASPTTLDLSIQ